MSVITVSIHMQNFAHVMNYVSKAEQTPDLSDKTVQDKLKVCAALAHFDSRKYKQAAKKFLEVQFNTVANKFPEVISAQDITVYTTLAALAEFERSEIKARVIDNSDFRNFLELVPEIRDIVHDFYNSKYGSCLTALDKIRGDLQLDLHLHDHVNSLYSKIRNKAIVQYFSPFVSVDLNNMAQAFATDVATLEKELAALIVDGTIQARIDSHNKRLYARQSDERNTTFQKSLNVGEQFQRDSKAILLRVNLIRNDFVVKPSRNADRDSGREHHDHRRGPAGAGASSAGDKPDRKMQ
jgi:COP9 signalosome complex subunit 1